MPFVQKAFPNPQTFQEQTALWGDAFTNPKSVIGPGFDDQNVVNSLMAKC